MAPTHFFMLAADPDMPSCTAETAEKYRVLDDKVQQKRVGTWCCWYTGNLLSVPLE